MGMFGKKTVNNESNDRIAELEKQLKEYKDKLAFSEYELKSVNRSAHLGLWKALFDEQGNQSAVCFSDEFRKLVGGYSTTELKDEVDDYLAIIHKDDLDRVMKAYTAALMDRTGNKKYDIDYRLKTKQGEYKWFHAAGEVIRTLDGTPKEFLGSLHDIDDAKQNEEAVKLNSIRRQALDRIMEEGSWSVDLTQYAMDDTSAP